MYKYTRGPITWYDLVNEGHKITGVLYTHMPPPFDPESTVVWEAERLSAAQDEFILCHGVHNTDTNAAVTPIRDEIWLVTPVGGKEEAEYILDELRRL